MRTQPQPATPPYTPYHPRWYRTHISTYWWMHRWVYFRFVMRELTSFGVAYFCVMTLLLVRSLSRGPEAFQAFQSRLASPLFICMTVLALFLTLFHTITWFSLSAHAMVVRIGGKRIPGSLITAGNYFAWIVVSAFFIWLFMGMEVIVRV
jgi:fumarate reductase subunit C